MFWSCNENFFRCEKSLKTTLLSTHFNIYLNLEASLHSIITVICINPYSPNKLIATKYCFLILGDDTSFFFFFFLLLFLLFYVIVNFYKNYLIFNVFFHENYFYFFMFRDVPGCSGMFRNVPECFFPWKLFLFFHVPRRSAMFWDVPECSVFLVLSTPKYLGFWTFGSRSLCIMIFFFTG